MSKKYHSAAHSTIITNDLFLAAFLSTVGCSMSRMERNDRRRVSFVFTGSRVRELREAYRTGPVHLDIRFFRENLNKLRNRLGEMVTADYPEERSTSTYVRTNNAATDRGSTELGTLSRIPSYTHA